MKKIFIYFCVIYTLVSMIFLGVFLYNYWAWNGAIAACNG